MPSNPLLPLLSLLRLISGMKMQMAALLLCLLCSMFSAHVRSLPKNPTLPSEPFRMWTAIPQTSPSPAISPNCHGCSPSPSISKSEHNHKHRHQGKSHAASPPPSSQASAQGCDQITCSDPLTSAPTGSPCGCVFPIQVGLVLGVVVCTIYPKTTELETEIAAGTYLEQRQVRITRADADSQDQGKTIVHIDLVPLGEKFNRTTALLIYDRFWKKKVSINMTLVGDYEVKYVQYPGLPSSPPSLHGNRPPSGRHQDPVSAAITSKRRKMNARSIAFIVFSSSVVFLTCIVAVVIYLKYLKPGSLPADSPFLISSIIKRAGKGIRHRLSSSRASSISPFLNSPRDACGLSVKRFSLAELEKATEKFSSKKILGQGGFGRVYLGTMEDGSEVAVKLLTRKDQRGDREFAAEIEILSRLHHRNLVKLVGICIEKQTRCLVYELVRNGSVESHLHGADLRRGPLDWDARVKIALGAARGLAYLHEDSYPRVIHRDFKASNILLEDDFTPKVSDFGLAREASEGNEQISTQVMGTFGYVAPEYAMTGHLLVKSDVYSYGVVLLELLSGRKPVDMSQPQGQESLVVWARPLFSSKEGLEQLVDPSLGGNFNFDSMARVAAIASMCVNPEVSQRPFMGEVVQALKLIYDDMEETCEDPSSLRENSRPSVVPESNSWWDGGNHSLTHGLPSIMMDYSSGSFDRIERPISTLTLTGGGGSLTEYNRSGPLRTERDEVAFYRMRGSVSDNGLLVKHFGFKGYMV